MAQPIRRVAVTGGSGYVGSRVIQRPEREESVERIVAIDVRPPGRPAGPKVVVVQGDVSGSIEQVLSDHAIDAVAHLAFILKPSRNPAFARRVNVEGTRRVLEGCFRAGVRHFVYLSSSTVYGAHHDNPSLITEESPLRPVKGFQYGEDKVLVEAVIEEFLARSGAPTAAVLRSCPVLGPNADNYVARSFSGPLLVRVKGSDPPMQFLHEEDLAELMAHCILDQVSGVYNAAGDGTIAWHEVTDGSGKVVLHLPHNLLYGMTSIGWRLGLQSNAPPAGLNFIRYPWVASTEKLTREVGFKFRHSSREALLSFVRRREDTAALGAQTP